MYYNVKESGMRIKELRKKNGYTQESFASEIGISYRTYSGIESGAHSTSIDVFVAISNVLNVSLDYIILGKKDVGMLKGVSEDKRVLAEKILKGILENI
jgi:transcriptional regulator with XRE-family HTH domain